MELSQIKEIVNHQDTKQYRVKLSNGKSRIVRLWLHTDGCVCIITKGKKHYGHHLSSYSWDNLDEWVSIKLVEHTQCNMVKRVKRRAQDAVKYLNQSGFWPDIKNEIEYFLSDDSIIEDFCKDMARGSYENFYKKCRKGEKYEWCKTYQVFESFYSNKCWKSIAYHSKFDRNWYNEEVKKAIEEKTNYHRRWTNGYDNSLEIKFDNEYPRAWYSEEYRGCGNGHYYLLFDATHAIFYEND